MLSTLRDEISSDLSSFSKLRGFGWHLKVVCLFFSTHGFSLK